MKQVFAEVGASLQQVGGSCPSGWIVMQGERPTLEHVAQADGKWTPIVMTDEEMKASEIEQDKAFLASTDWIIAKMGEASFTGQDTAPLIAQYSAQLEQREMARVRIRIAEGWI